MRQLQKMKKPKKGRLKRRTLCLVLTTLALAFTALGAYAAEKTGVFGTFAENTGGYSVSTKDGLTSGGETTPVAETSDGSKWVAASDSADNNTWYLYLEGETEKPVVTLTMDGNVWTYYFTVVDSETAEYYVSELINRSGDYELTTDPSYQLVDGDGNVVEEYTKAGSNGSVILYNSIQGEKPPAFGSLELTKNLVDSDGNKLTSEDDDTVFRFTITLSYTLEKTTDSAGETTVKDGSAVTAALLTGSQYYGDYVFNWTSESNTGKEEDGGDVTTTVYTADCLISLQAGGSVTLSDIPAGVSYTVAEADTEGYEMTGWIVDPGTDADTADGDDTGAGAADENGTDGDAETAGGDGTEEDAETAGGDGTDMIAEAAGVVEKDGTASITCINQAPEPEEPVPTGSVRVKKSVVNYDGTEAGNDTNSFDMKLSLTGLKPGASYSYRIYNADGSAAGQETGNDANGSAAGQETGNDADGSGEGQAAEDGDTGSISYSAGADGSASVDFSLTNGQYAEFTGLPAGCTYRAVEAAAEDYTASYELSGGGENPSYASSKGANYEDNKELMTEKETLDDGEMDAEGVTPVTVTFTNKKPEEPDDSIKVTINKKWYDAKAEDGGTTVDSGGTDEDSGTTVDSGGADANGSDEKENDNDAHNGEEITIYLYRSLSYLDSTNLDGSDAEQVAIVNLNGTDDGWTYTSPLLDRCNAGGEPWYYYIKEEGVEGYTSLVSVTESPYEKDEKGNITATGDSDYSFTVTNSSSKALPYTGGAGTAPFTVAGLILAAGAAACLPAAKRRRERGPR